MELKKIIIDDFRSIDRVVIEDIKPVNIFIGKNNTGKSNILKGLELLFSRDPHIEDRITQDDVHKKVKNRKILLWCFFSLSHDEKRSMHDEIKKNEKLIESDEYSNYIKDFFDSNYLDIKYYKAIRWDYDGWYLGYKKISNYYGLWTNSRKTAINSKILKLFKKKLDNFTLIDVNDSFRAVDKDKYNKISRNLSNYFLSDGEKRKDYIKLKRSLNELLEGLNSEPRPVREVKGRVAKYDLKIDIDEEISLPLTNMGDGLQRISYIFYELIFSQNKIIAIEEPENGLHIGAQKNFIRLLYDIAKEKNKIIFMTTHSPIFINENENYSIYKTTLVENKTKITKVKRYDEIYKLSKELGLKPSDFLFSNGIIWVEGPSDMNILNEWLKTKGYDLDSLNISMMFYGGGNLSTIGLEDLKKLNPNLLIVIDSDRNKEGVTVKKFKRDMEKECSDNKILCWITKRREIENYFCSETVAEYYNITDGFENDHYLPFDKKIKEVAKHQGLQISYNKLRDSAGIASQMTIEDIKNDFELNSNLDEIIDEIDTWK